MFVLYHFYSEMWFLNHSANSLFVTLKHLYKHRHSYNICCAEYRCERCVQHYCIEYCSVSRRHARAQCLTAYRFYMCFIHFNSLSIQRLNCTLIIVKIMLLFFNVRLITRSKIRIFVYSNLTPHKNVISLIN